MAQTGTRFAARAKRRRINRWLNGAIAVVVLLILIVGGNLLFGGEPGEKAVDRGAKTEAANAKRVEVETGASTAPAEEEGTASADEQSEPADETSESNVTETPGPPGSNVEKEIVNPAWQPIGTTQSEPHETVFQKDSVDWKEMLDAVSYATGIAPEEMIVWFIGNNGPNKAVATISQKDQTAHYKVYIEWVTNEGWKPTKVQKLKQKP
ncbi:YrrS family protein [Geobacillus jurassicus]|uniref:YrrS family protein n=1 Tax=Geobacillus jurassicus TaxID=235932 RepID=A0ABV6GNW6_9BACL|nr:YrrS family protein [Geobacillus jurassicus]